MVIHQFNKLIRNKWVWGVFAVAISAFFAFDFLLDDIQRDDGDSRPVSEAGKLAGEPVDAKLFSALAEEARGIGNQRDWKSEQADVNLQAWRNYAALQVAGKAGIEATDAEVMAAIRRDPSFQANGAFSFALYERLLRENSLTPERFEASLKRSFTLRRIGRAVLGSAAWASPMELDQALADMTDVFTVKVAHFTQDKKEADAVTIDEAGVRKWYEANTNSLALPERQKIRFVKFDATDAKVLAKMAVTENDLRDRYDATLDKYTTKGTNDTEIVKKFEEVKGEIEKEVRQIAAIEFFETNLNSRVYSIKAAAGASRLDEIAREEGLKVATSDWFSTSGGWQEGFMKRSYAILPGAKNFDEAVAELDAENEDLRYAVISSEKAVWLVEKSETSPAHVPTFEEAKDIIRPRALKAAREDAFKATVEAIAKKGADAVRAVKGVSTNIVFSIADLQPGAFPDQSAVARAAAKLSKGDVSEFTATGSGRAILVVCEDRKDGDAAKTMILKGQVQNDVTMLAANQIPESWRKWNLERLGFEAGEISSVEKTAGEEE